MLLWAGSAAAQSPCRQALAIGLDVSGSVDEREYALQLGGLATALNDAQVRAQLLSGADWPILIAVYEWSGLADQTLLVPWTTLRQDSDIDSVVARLKTHNRALSAPTTALGQAMRHGAALLRQAPPCRRLTLDISGDGKSNIGLRPQDVRGKGLLVGVTVNALVIGADSPHGGDARQVEIGELSAYFRYNVIQGDSAFVEVALGFEDYARAMTEKLLRETQGPPIGWLHP